MTIRILLLLLLASAPCAAANVVIAIDTPCYRHTFAQCELSDVVFQRHTTVATLIAHCASAQRATQAPGWQPGEHPDGAPLAFEGRVRVGWRRQPWQRCEVTDFAQLSDGSGFVQAECLDDPVGAPLRTCATLLQAGGAP